MKLRYLIDCDPDNYSYDEAGTVCVRFILVGDDGWARDREMWKYLPEEVRSQVDEEMESHFRFEGTEGELVALLDKHGIEVFDGPHQLHHVKKPGEPRPESLGG